TRRPPDTGRPIAPAGSRTTPVRSRAPSSPATPPLDQLDRIDRAHLDTLSAARTPLFHHEQPAPERPESVLRAGQQACATALASPDLGDQVRDLTRRPAGRHHGACRHCAHVYPRGVTNRPPTMRDCEHPTVTTVYISARTGSNVSSVARPQLSSGRDALRTQPTGVEPGRCAAKIPSALPSCQSRCRERGL